MIRTAVSRLASMSLLIAVIVSGAAFTSGAAGEQETSLSGPNIIRRSRPADEALTSSQRSTSSYNRLRTEIIHGEKLAGGYCSYSLKFRESFDDPTSKLVWMTAVDPVACQFEFEIGAIEPVESAPSQEMQYLTAQARGRSGSADDGGRDRQGFAHPESVSQLLSDEPSPIIALGRRDQKLTVVGVWEDFVTVDVTKVLVAVSADARGNDFVDAECKYAWGWREGTGWQHAENNEWTDCRRSNTRATALANGHFKNPYFITCVPEVVHVYYDRLWAKVAAKDNLDHGHFDWGIRDTWAEGADCKDMIRWSRFFVIKNEYSTGWIH